MSRLTRVSLGVLVIGLTLTCVHFYLLDGLFGTLLARIYPDETRYAPTYSDSGFRQLEIGMDESSVRRSLGEPLSEDWRYGSCGPGSLLVSFNVKRVVDSVGGSRTPDVTLKLTGAGVTDVLAQLGKPACKALAYTQPSSHGSFRVRAVLVESDHVVKVTHGYYVD